MKNEVPNKEKFLIERHSTYIHGNGKGKSTLDKTECSFLMRTVLGLSNAQVKTTKTPKYEITETILAWKIFTVSVTKRPPSH